MTIDAMAKRCCLFLACILVSWAASCAPGMANFGGGGGGDATVPPELRGVWDGPITLSVQTGQTGTATLILGDKSVLIIHGKGKVRLIPQKKELEPEHFLIKHRRTFMTFKGEPLEGDLTAWKVRVESPRMMQNGELESKITTYIAIAPAPPGSTPEYRGEAGGELFKPVPLAAVYGQGPRYPYFAYADWRSDGWTAPADSNKDDGMRARVTRLAERLKSSNNWELLTGGTLIIPADEPFHWQVSDRQWVGERIYVFCAHEDDNLAIRVNGGGVPFHIERAGPTLDYPALLLDPYLDGWSHHSFTLQQYPNDPDAALQDAAKAEPLKVTVLIFGRDPGDQGPGFDFSSLPE